MRKQRWAVYYESHEYAKATGDPCLGYVWAADKKEAERVARAGGMGGVGGAWCIPAPTVKNGEFSLEA